MLTSLTPLLLPPYPAYCYSYDPVSSTEKFFSNIPDEMLRYERDSKVPLEVRDAVRQRLEEMRTMSRPTLDQRLFLAARKHADIMIKIRDIWSTRLAVEEWTLCKVDFIDVFPRSPRYYHRAGADGFVQKRSTAKWRHRVLAFFLPLRRVLRWDVIGPKVLILKGPDMGRTGRIVGIIKSRSEAIVRVDGTTREMRILELSDIARQLPDDSKTNAATWWAGNKGK